MYLQWFLASVMITSTNAVTRLFAPDLQAVNFAKEIRGRRLNGSVIKEMEVDSEVSCQLQCVKENGCLSYNFGPSENKRRFNCELSNSDRFVGWKNFTEDHEFLYRGVKSICEIERSPCEDKGVCIPDYEEHSAQCKCQDGYAGKPCEAKSCAQLFQDGFTSSGVHTINPDGGKPIQVLCDMTTDEGGWTVFQRRLHGSVDFYRGWESYKNGFGDLNGEFWLGNDNLHRLTAADDVTVRVDLEDFDGDIRYAEYTTFRVADEADKYRILIGGYSGTAGDAITYHSGMRFSTNDNDNDVAAASCAQNYKGAWWYNGCLYSNLNGLYLGGPHSSGGVGVNWGAFRGINYSLKRTEMKVKAKS